MGLPSGLKKREILQIALSMYPHRQTKALPGFLLNILVSVEQAKPENKIK
jgi:hypothetical protein